MYTVGELTEEIRDLLEGHFEFVWVEGEISNFSAPLSGHYYMILKDEKAQIRAVMFRHQARYLKFMPEDGMKVIAQGRIGIYAPRGEYQILLDYVEPVGVGALAVAFEQVKMKLAAQGVFDAAVKRPLPFLPQRVAVITSPTGAAIRDFLKVIHRRFANVEIVVVPVRVQGDGATEDMINALDTVNRELPVDVIVLTRGGGSLEDLWAFNQEGLALAIRRSNIPVISAVGHEIDVTISDLAADFRAPTPSAAAEMLVTEKEALLERLGQMAQRLEIRIRWILRKCRDDVETTTRHLRDPRRRLADSWLHLDDLSARLIRLTQSIIKERERELEGERRALNYNSPDRLIRTLRQEMDFCGRTLLQATITTLNGKKATLASTKKRLEDLNPLSILRRGYSIAMTLPHKEVVRNALTVASGDRIQVLLGQGELECRVERTQGEENPLLATGHPRRP